jgi:hypothetical protein
MAFITREDGEHFVIPSYRDVLTAKQKSQLRKDILLLSRSYGEYITLQKQNASQYEVAFSSDVGYLLGESVWHHFNKPQDMIYCEAIPNTADALLVIVKSGSVYLDGSFSLDSIPEELIIFLTQQNNFEIYIYGDVPINEQPEAGKFSFEASSVKSFTVLDKPVFPTLPLLKIYQLQLVDTVLKAQGIGVFPVKPILSLLVLAALAWAVYSYFLAKPAVVVQEEVPVVNPYQAYLDALKSPAPDEEIANLIQKLKIFIQLPGWNVKSVKYIHNNLNVTVMSQGGKVEDLFAWAKNNKVNMFIRKSGIFLSTYVAATKRPIPTTIYSTPKVIARLVDKLAEVYPGNRLELGEFINKGVFTQVLVTIRLQDISFVVLNLIGQQLKDLPIALHDVSFTLDESSEVTGSITMDVLGN